MSNIELVKKFCGKVPATMYTFPSFYVYNVGGWDGLIKVTKNDKKVSTFCPFDYSKELIHSFLTNPVEIVNGKDPSEEEIEHSEMVSDVYSSLFEDDHIEHTITDDVYASLFEDDYIEHHGILGMSWGKKNGPPYPLRAGDHSPKEKKAAEAAGVKVGKDSGKGSMENVKKKNILEQIGDKMKANKVAKQRKAALDKAREAKQKKAEEDKTAEQHEAEKKKALESGDYTQIQKYANESTTKELQDAITRADTLARLNQKVIDNTPVEPTTWDTINNIASKVGTVTNAAGKGIEAWNKVASVWNTFADVDSMLPEIGKNFKDTKEKILNERAEKDRKETIEKIIKSNDPDKILKNQELFTNEEIKGAQSRLANIDSINKIKGNRANSSNSSDSSNSSSKSNDSSDDTLEQIKNKRIAAEEKIKEERKKEEAEYAKRQEERYAWKKKEEEQYRAEEKARFDRDVQKLLHPETDDYFKEDIKIWSQKNDKKYSEAMNKYSASVNEVSNKPISESNALSNSIFAYLNSEDPNWRMKQ